MSENPFPLYLKNGTATELKGGDVLVYDDGVLFAVRQDRLLYLEADGGTSILAVDEEDSLVLTVLSIAEFYGVCARGREPQYNAAFEWDISN